MLKHTDSAHLICLVCSSEEWLSCMHFHWGDHERQRRGRGLKVEDERWKKGAQREEYFKIWGEKLFMIRRASNQKGERKDGRGGRWRKYMWYASIKSNQKKKNKFPKPTPYLQHTHTQTNTQRCILSPSSYTHIHTQEHTKMHIVYFLPSTHPKDHISIFWSYGRPAVEYSARIVNQK